MLPPAGCNNHNARWRWVCYVVVLRWGELSVVKVRKSFVSRIRACWWYLVVIVIVEGEK